MLLFLFNYPVLLLYSSSECSLEHKCPSKHGSVVCFLLYKLASPIGNYSHLGWETYSYSFWRGWNIWEFTVMWHFLEECFTILGLFNAGKSYNFRLIKNTIMSLYIVRAFPSARRSNIILSTTRSGQVSPADFPLAFCHHWHYRPWL